SLLGQNRQRNPRRSQRHVPHPAAPLGPQANDSRPPLPLPSRPPRFFSIENGQGTKRTLNLGEAVLRQREVNTVMSGLRRRGIKVTAMHNHWLFEKPRLMYMHWEAAMDPARFLRSSRAALKAAKVKTRPL